MNDRVGIFRLLFIRRIRVARRRGEISQKDYETALATLRRDDATQRVFDEAVPASGIDWSRISQWIKDNWLEILKVVLTIAVLFLDNSDDPPYTTGGGDHVEPA